MVTRTQMLRYPFSRYAREISSSVARDVGELVKLLDNDENEYIVEHAESRVAAALDKLEIKLVNTNDDRDFLIYPTARLIVEAIGNSRLKEYQAEVESKAVNKFLGKEDDDFIMELASESFGWHVKSVGNITQRARLPPQLRTYGFKIQFQDFLEVAPDFHEPVWKLVNRYLDSGWVPVQKSELSRLISGKFNKIILGSHIDVPPLPRRLAESIQRIESELSRKIKSTGPVELTEESEDAFPPCISQMHKDTRAGKNLSHSARFALASFLLNIGMSVSEVVDVFRAARDYVSSLAEYQVKHIAGERGGRDAYTPPSCKKMQSDSLCPVYLGEAFDPLCEYISHPLSFYETRAWELSKGVEDHSWYARKKKKRQHLG